MSRRGPESKIQDAVIKYAREKHRALCKKNDTGMRGGTAGWPDYTIFPYSNDAGSSEKRKPFFMEFKAPGAVLTLLQMHMFNELGSRGYNCYKIDSVAYGKIVIDQECE